MPDDLPEIVTLDLRDPKAGTPLLRALDAEFTRLMAEGKEAEAIVVCNRMHAIVAGVDERLN